MYINKSSGSERDISGKKKKKTKCTSGHAYRSSCMLTTQFMESGSEQGDKSRNTICMEEEEEEEERGRHISLSLFEACLCVRCV